ncbi:MAG: hypothetical protein MJE63_14385 [Proteobacteria bacterium]|nr:hypothetical protein [Pseudomonadota bacterium]
MKTNSITNTKSKRGRRTRKQVKISREFIDNAVEEYLKNGGKITELKPVERSLSEIMAGKDTVENVDEILGKA